MRKAAILVGVAMALGPAAGVTARADDDIVRTPLQSWQIPAGEYDLNTMYVVIRAGGTSGRHTHPGVESSYVISGEPELKIDGEADRRLKPGETFLIAPGLVHEVIAGAGGPVVLVLSYVTERGKPLVTNVP